MKRNLEYLSQDGRGSETYILTGSVVGIRFVLMINIRINTETDKEAMYKMGYTYI